MITTKITITNKAGLHARAAAKLVEVASRFACNVQIGNQEKKVDGKSILSIMLLAAAQGTELDLILDGEDEDEALTAIQQLIERRFGEE